MKKHFEFLTLTLLVIITRIGDGITTQMATPDLSKELNPLASGGWLTLIFVASIVVGFSIFLNFRQVYFPLKNPFPINDNDFKSFKKTYFDPSKNPIIQDNLLGFLIHIFGYILPRTLIIWSTLLIINNLLTAFSFDSYIELKQKYPVWLFFYLSLPVIGLILVERLQKLDFTLQSRQLNKGQA